jgi:hypothetical protein
MINAISSAPPQTANALTRPLPWFDDSFPAAFQSAIKAAAPVTKAAEVASASPATAAAAAIPAAASNSVVDTPVNQGNPGMLYPTYLPNGQPDFDTAHDCANILYEGDYLANPATFNAAAEQAKYKGMTDNQVTAAWLQSEQTFFSLYDKPPATSPSAVNP